MNTLSAAILEDDSYQDIVMELRTVLNNCDFHKRSHASSLFQCGLDRQYQTRTRVSVIEQEVPSHCNTM